MTVWRRRLMRAPLVLYRVGLGRLLGHRFLRLEHTGRRSGVRREAVLEVVERGPGRYVVTSGYGRASQWFRNVLADPEVAVTTVGVRSAPATAHVYARDEAVDFFRRLRRRRPRSAALLGRLHGVDAAAADAAERFADAIPVVAFRLRDVVD